MDNKKNINTYNQAGQLKIAEDVMAIIAGLAISDQEGVYATERSSGKKNHGNNGKRVFPNKGEDSFQRIFVLFHFPFASPLFSPPFPAVPY